MLVQGLEQGESVTLDDLFMLRDGKYVPAGTITVKFLYRRSHTVHIGIDAPRAIPIVRFCADGLRQTREIERGGGARQ